MTRKEKGDIQLTLTDNNKRRKQVQYINTSKIHNDLWDARLSADYNEKDETFIILKNNIEINGLFTPITVIENNKKDETYYSVVDGRRRFEAMKQLGFKEIDCFVIDSGKNESEIAVLSLIQNLHRKDLDDIERCKGIIAIFEKAGYSIDETITNCKRLHNARKDPITSAEIDQDFVKLVNSIGYSANFIYQLVQLVRDIPFNVLKHAQKKGLSTRQKILLTHTRLKDHPEIQKELVDELSKTKDINYSRIVVYQTIRDLETGALFKSGKTYHVHTHLRDKIDVNKVEYTPYKNYFEIRKHANNLLRFLTNHQLSQGEYEYNKNHINYSAQHRMDIVKNLDSGSIVGLIEQLRMLRYAIDSMESIISSGEEEVNKTFE